MTSRPGPSPPDAGLWCETTPFSMCSRDCMCYRPPSAKARAARSRGTWMASACTSQGFGCTREAPTEPWGPSPFRQGSRWAGSTRFPRNTKAGGPIPSSPQLRALLRLEAPVAEKAKIARCRLESGARGSEGPCQAACWPWVTRSPGWGRPAAGKRRLLSETESHEVEPDRGPA